MLGTQVYVRGCCVAPAGSGSRRDIESCPGDASLCTRVLCSSSRVRQSAGHRELCWGRKSMYGGVVLLQQGQAVGGT